MRLLDPGMTTYRVGSIVSGSSVLSGILEEHAYCRNCLKAKREHEVPVFLVELSEEVADALLRAVDRPDLIA